RQGGDPEVTFDRALSDAHVLDVLVRDGGFVDDPHAAAEAHAAVGHDVPRRVVAQVEGDVGDDVGDDGDHEVDREEEAAHEGVGHDDGDPGDGQDDVDAREGDPEIELAVVEEAGRGLERPRGL